MIDAIEDKLLDILTADSRLYAGGNAYPTGWTGVKRIEGATAPVAGYVSIYDHAQDPRQILPFVCIGDDNSETFDSPDFEAIGNDGYVQFRLASIPLIVIADGTGLKDAKRKRNQLVGNIERILQDRDSMAVEGYWYDLTVGSIRRRHYQTGGGTQAKYEAKAVLTVEIRYSRTESSDA